MPLEVAQAAAAAVDDAPTLGELGDRLVGALAGRLAFDRLNIGLIDASRNVFHDAYVFGHNVPGRATGHQRPLDGTVVEAAIRAGDGFCFGSAEPDGWLARFPRFGPVLESGIRAMLAVPIREGGAVAAALVLASRDPYAYGEQELAAAIAVGRSIAPRVLALRGSGAG